MKPDNKIPEAVYAAPDMDDVQTLARIVLCASDYGQIEDPGHQYLG